MVQNKNTWPSSMVSAGRKYLEICTWTYAHFSSVSSSVKTGRKNTVSPTSRVIKWLLWRATHGTSCSCAPIHPPTWLFFFFPCTYHWVLCLNPSAEMWQSVGLSPAPIQQHSCSMQQDVIFISVNSRQLFKLTFFKRHNRTFMKI